MSTCITNASCSGLHLYQTILSAVASNTHYSIKLEGYPLYTQTREEGKSEREGGSWELGKEKRSNRERCTGEREYLLLLFMEASTKNAHGRINCLHVLFVCR